MSSMKVFCSERGAVSGLLISFILSIFLLCGAFGFGVWAYMERDTYKNDTDQIVEKEVAVAVERAKTAKDNEFVEREKQPYNSYLASETLGGFSVQYPKTWSVYSNDDASKASVIFHPRFVPADDTTAYALRVQVLPKSYDSVAATFANDVKTAKLKAAAFSLAKLPDVVGLRLDGEIKANTQDKKRGSIVILPLRDKTIVVTTESETFLGDFNDIILPNFTFKP